MNANLKRLFEISQKSTRHIIGLMSGTSLDGLDIALCAYSGSGLETQVKVLAFETIPYTEEFKDQIKAVFAKKHIDFEHLCLLNPSIGLVHAELIQNFLQKNQLRAEDIDCIASHGQTVYHAPYIQHKKEGFPNATLQIGDADHIAVKTGIITLSDFRQKHCAAGGEGAPLALYGDYLIFSKKGSDRVLLNMGGISNYTYLSGDLDPNKAYATDTGPGNTMIDKLVQTELGLAYDPDGQHALAGQISEPLLQALKEQEYFKKTVPKTTGPEVFNLDLLKNCLEKTSLQGLGLNDQLATLARFTAETIAETIHNNLKDLKAPEMYMSGGGMYNKAIVQHLISQLPQFKISNTHELGINPDAKEAMLFATLANEALVGGQTNFGSRLGVPSISMGKVSFPK
jgi:anhydro-N-acetylmuramic acid kinase